jgi:hypothetical protein
MSTVEPRSLDSLVQELVPHGAQPVLQLPVAGLQCFHESIKGIVLAPVPVELSAQLSEAVVPCPSSALQLLSPEVKNAGERGIRKHSNTKGMRERASNPTENTYLEDPPRGTPVDPQRLGQRIVN